MAAAAAPLGQLTFSVEAKRDTLPQAIELLGEILREPAFPEAEFETTKRAHAAGMRRLDRTEPSALAGNKLARALSPYGRTTSATCRRSRRIRHGVEAVTLEQVKALYETQLGGDARRAGRRRRLRPGRDADGR